MVFIFISKVLLTCFISFFHNFSLKFNLPKQSVTKPNLTFSNVLIKQKRIFDNKWTILLSLKLHKFLIALPKCLTYIKSILYWECCHFYSNIVCFNEKKLLIFSYVDTFYTSSKGLLIKNMGLNLFQNIK